MSDNTRKGYRSDKKDISIDIYSVYLHVYPIVLFLVMISIHAIVLLNDRHTSYMPTVSLLTVSIILFNLQTYIVPESESSKCIHAVCWFWIFWIIYGILWPIDVVISVNSQFTTLYWFVSTLQCTLGIEAHYRHTVNVSDIDKSEQLILFGYFTPITRDIIAQIFTLIYCILFIICPHQSSVFTYMFPVEAFIRPVIMYMIVCSTIAVHSCTRKNVQWQLLLRESSWVCLANPWCVVFFLYQLFSLLFAASNCFSFLGSIYQEPSSHRRKDFPIHTLASFKPLRHRSSIKHHKRTSRLYSPIQESDQLLNDQKNVQRLMRQSENIPVIINQITDYV